MEWENKLYQILLKGQQEVDDGFTTILTFEGGTEVLVEVGTNNYISLPRWYVLGEDGTAVIRDWQLNGEIIRKTGITEEKVVPVKIYEFIPQPFHSKCKT